MVDVAVPTDLDFGPRDPAALDTLSTAVAPRPVRSSADRRNGTAPRPPRAMVDAAVPVGWPSKAKAGGLGLTQDFVKAMDTTQSTRVEFIFPATYGVLGNTRLRSAAQKVTFQSAPPWGEDDEQTLAVSLHPAGDQHRLHLHLGGRCATGYYQMSFASLDDTIEFHVPAKAYIRTVVETDVYLAREQVLAIEASLTLPLLVRMKPNDSPDGPLVNLCGCC